MKARLLVHLVIFCLGSLALFAQPAGPRNEALSRNRKFSAELSEPEINKPLLAVFERSGDDRKLLWSRVLGMPEEMEQHGNNPFGGGRPVRILAANDGGLAVLMPLYSNSEEAAVRVVKRSGADVSFTTEDLVDSLGDLVEEDHYQSFSGERPLELHLEDEKPPLLAIWLSRLDEWLAIDLDAVKPFLATGLLKEKLNTLGRERALEIIKESDGGSGLARSLSALRRRAADVVPGLLPEQRASEDIGRTAAYRFIGARKVAEDKPLIERLLEGPSYGVYSGGPFNERHMRITSGDKLLADDLLARWDSPAPAESERGFYNARKSKRFGVLSGVVELPFKIPDQAGMLWLYLIPNSIPKGEFMNHGSEVLTVNMSLNLGTFGGREPERLDRVRFGADALNPGEYRIKAIWDRRAPMIKPGTGDTLGVAEAGDYESAESEPVRVSASEETRGLRLACTNRVGEASTYYAADDAWAKLNPVNPEFEEESYPPESWGSTVKVLKTVPLEQVQTTANTGELKVKRVRLEQWSDRINNHTNRWLAIRFSTPPPKNRNEYLSYEGKLEDEHGCTFESRGASSGRRYSEVHFGSVPFGSQTFRIRINQQDHTGNNNTKDLPSFALVLTNNFEIQPEVWKPEPLPAKRELDIVTVSLDDFNPASNEHQPPYAQFAPGVQIPGQPPRPENHFTMRGRDGSEQGWTKMRGTYFDRWNNQGYSLGEFCKREEVFRYVVQVAREPDPAFFSKNEIWELPVPKVPGPGEFIALNLTNQLEGLPIRLYALSGTGQFTYENGRVRNATNRVADGGFRDRFMAGRQQQPVPKLYVIQTQPFFGGRARVPITLASKIPHLSCRYPSAGTDVLVGVLEQDTSVPEPMNSRGFGPFGPIYHGPPGPSAQKFIPLDFRPGETDRKITFLIQKPRTAEFFVRR